MTLLEPTLQVRQLHVYKGSDLAFDCVFHQGVNAVRGRNSSGKTTIMDLLAYSLGAESIRWKPEALLCSHTVAEVQLNDGVATLRREISSENQRPMEIFWGSLEDAIAAPIQSWQRYPFKRSANLISFSQALLSAMRMPQAQGDGASNLTMHQILRVLYADQPSVHSPIFRIDRWDSALTREMIGGYLAGVYDDELYSSQLRVREIDAELSQLVSELKGIFNILGHTGNTPDLILTNNRIETLEESRRSLTERLTELKSGILPKEKKNQLSKLEKLRRELSAARSAKETTLSSIESLELEISDSKSFISEIRKRISDLADSKAARSELTNLSFEFCPCCLAETTATLATSCHLCKAPLVSDEGRESQLLRMRNELDLQLKESTVLIEKRENELSNLRAKLSMLSSEVKRTEVRYYAEAQSAPSPIESEIEELARSLGAIDEEIRQADRLQSLSAAVADLQKRRDDLSTEKERLNDLIEVLEAKQGKRKSEVSLAIEKAMVRILRQDFPLQPEFVNAESVEVDFVENYVYVNGSRNFSESSAVILRHGFHLALLTASTQLSYMRVPRFIMLDGIDDGGMEKERSHNLQRIIVDECESYEVDYQVIYATSEINPDYEDSALVVGRFFTPEARSLNIKSLSP